MLSFILLLLLLTITVLVILVLRKNQQKHTKETVDRTAPLPALGNNTLPDFAPPPASSAPVKVMENWQVQIKNLRASQRYDDALDICRSQYPRAQAIQQAAIILRQKIKISQKSNTSYELVLQSLYSLAALADIYSNGPRHKSLAVGQVLAILENLKQKYLLLGYQKLKLLNKSDARLLEQAWGKPDAHRHVAELQLF